MGTGTAETEAAEAKTAETGAAAEAEDFFKLGQALVVADLQDEEIWLLLAQSLNERAGGVEIEVGEDAGVFRIRVAKIAEGDTCEGVLCPNGETVEVTAAGKEDSRILGQISVLVEPTVPFDRRGNSGPAS